VVLYSTSPVFKDAEVLVSYNGGTVYGIDGVELNPFTNLMASNSSTVTDVNEPVAPKFAVYPNPNTTGLFQYEYALQNSHVDNARVEVFLNNGTRIYQNTLTASKGTIDLSGFDSKGLYMFRFILGNTEITRTLVRE
jgi:hypothetical protein